MSWTASSNPSGLNDCADSRSVSTQCNAASTELQLAVRMARSSRATLTRPPPVTLHRLAVRRMVETGRRTLRWTPWWLLQSISRPAISKRRVSDRRAGLVLIDNAVSRTRSSPSERRLPDSSRLILSKQRLWTALGRLLASSLDSGQAVTLSDPSATQTPRAP